ncbi:chemotaxis protein CheW [Melioribacteraceae bacterium 4301-Me]|uniref:chemotaxis protein CheW n=1 Tax=Pyranulibacter aquaticus TaxID=3163344 RepID=UPI0035984DD4
MVRFLSFEKVNSSQKINWEKIKKQIKDAEMSLTQNFSVDIDTQNKILEKRASLFARESKEDKTSSVLIETLEFIIANEIYCLELKYISEAIKLKEITKINAVSPHLLGLANVRGKIISIIDIKKIFDLPPENLSNQNIVVVIQLDKIKFGFVVDKIIGISKIKLTDVQAPPTALTEKKTEFLMGITKEHKIVLDGAKLITYN